MVVEPVETTKCKGDFDELNHHTFLFFCEILHGIDGYEFKDLKKRGQEKEGKSGSLL